jgi:hypothetical protein
MCQRGNHKNLPLSEKMEVYNRNIYMVWYYLWCQASTGVIETYLPDKEDYGAFIQIKQLGNTSLPSRTEPLLLTWGFRGASLHYTFSLTIGCLIYMATLKYYAQQAT